MDTSRRIFLGALLLASGAGVALAQEAAAADDAPLVISMSGDIMLGTTFPSVMLPPNEGRDVLRDAGPDRPRPAP